MFYYITLGNHSEEKEETVALLVVGEPLDCVCETCVCETSPWWGESDLEVLWHRWTEELIEQKKTTGKLLPTLCLKNSSAGKKA